MYLQKENRECLGKIYGIIIFITITVPFGYLLYKNRDILNLNIIVGYFGGMFILAGAIMFMLWPKSPAPALFLFSGLAEQGVMLLLYLDFKLKYGVFMMASLIIIVAFCISGIRHLKLHLSDKELAALDPVPQEFKTYEYMDSRYSVQDPVAANLINERKKEATATVVDIRSARKPPMV
jgi:hypothetical protein